MCHFVLKENKLAFGGLDQICLSVGCSGGYFEHDNHLSDCIRIRNILDEMNKYLLLNNNSEIYIYVYTYTWCVQVLRSPKKAFAVAMQSWRERCEKCVCLQSDYVDK